MVRRSIPIEISEVLHQWQQGRSKTKISESLGIARPTLRKYLQLAMTAGLNALSSTTELAAIALSVQAIVAGNRNGETALAPFVKRAVHPAAYLMSDHNPAYVKIAEDFAGHSYVDHGYREYARGEVHNNTAESFNAMLERAMRDLSSPTRGGT